ncbi:MAG: hypothetical protein HeimC3_52100 [Candidatus Heimdallarchaeota archaeon LC_3]|nr:MAG: hypothetical protein HeimC3_52100 [Candidatus Heimdallarchaeota archaeon LC_3]
MVGLILDGLILSYLSDLGPIPIINLSPYDQTVTQKLSILGMSIILMGTGSPEIRTKRYMKIHGPIPLPYNPTHEVLCIPFNLQADFGSEDDRIVSFGRECILWFIYNIKKRNQIFSNSKYIEDITKECISTFKFESDLNDVTEFIKLFDILKETDYSKTRAVERKIIEMPSLDQRLFLLYGFKDNKELNILLEFGNLKEIDPLVVVDIENSTINFLLRKSISDTKLKNNMLSEINVVNSRLFMGEFVIKTIDEKEAIRKLLLKSQKYYESFNLPFKM